MSSKLRSVSYAGLVFAASSFAVAWAQAPLNFEVASVRAADSKPPYTPIPAAGVIKGGPGTDDPGRISYTWVLVRRLLMDAFGVPLDQIAGSDWVLGQDARFDIAAKVPEGATKEQVKEMLLNLLKDRFHLAYHSEQKDFDVYTLVVAKGGSKLKDAAPADGPLPPPPVPGTRAVAAPSDRDGFPILPAGRSNAQGHTEKGVSRMTFRMSTPATLLGMLGFSLGGARTVDHTGLTGKYDFQIVFSQLGLPGIGGRGGLAVDDITDPAPDLFTALEKQLGLKLEKSKTKLDVVVIDHMDKQPTEN
jgi:uncharacterized protein (TIGR03435 family)